MGRNNKKKSRETKTVNIVFPDHMSVEEMSHAIADGLMEFEARKQQKADEEKELREKEWQQALGVEDFSHVEQPRRRWLVLKNHIKVFWKMCTISEKDIKGEGLTFGIIQMILELFFKLLSVVLLLVFLILFVAGPVGLLWNNFSLLSIEIFANFWALGFLAFVLSRLFRIAGFEVANTNDRNYLFGLFACVTSLITIAITAATLFVTLR